jgi:hypothetical protein
VLAGGRYQRRAPVRTVLHELVARHAQSMLAELRDAYPDGVGRSALSDPGQAMNAAIVSQL